MSTSVAVIVPPEFANQVRAAFGTPDLPSQVASSRTPYDISRLDWIPWGKLNDEPDKYLELLETNAMFARIMAVIAAMIQGDGLTFKGPDAKIVEVWLGEMGVDSEFIERCAWDLAVLNCVGIRVSRTSRANGGVIASLEHLPAANLRSGKPDKFGRVMEGYYAVDWDMIDTNGRLVRGLREVTKNKEYYEVESMPVYNFDKVESIQLLWRNKTSPRRTFYPLPAVSSAYNTLLLQDEIIKFHLNSIQNGASSTMVLTYPRSRYIASEEGSEAQTQAQLEQAEIDKLVDTIAKDLKGVQNAGKPIVLTYDPNNPEWKPSMQAFPSSDNDKKWTTLISLNEITVLTALGVPSGELVGIPKPTGFSSKADELLTALETMRVQTINPLQNLLTESLNRIVADMGFRCEVGILDNNPISIKLTLDMVNAGVVTKDEYREMSLGLEPMIPAAEPAATPAPAMPAPKSKPNFIRKLWRAANVN